MRLLILFLLLTSCADTSTRLYNSDDLQDGACYGRFGGQWGYCDMIINKGVPK